MPVKMSRRSHRGRGGIERERVFRKTRDNFTNFSYSLEIGPAATCCQMAGTSTGKMGSGKGLEERQAWGGQPDVSFARVSLRFQVPALLMGSSSM